MKIIDVEIKKIKTDVYNPRKITPQDKSALKKSIEEFGLVKPLILNNHKGRENILIGGHQRLKILKELKQKSVPCIYVTYDIEKEKELNIRLNKNQGEFDFTKLEKNFEHDSLVKWGFSPFQFGEVHFVEEDKIEVEHVHKSAPKQEAVMLEIPMSPTEKKEIMLTINQYKNNRDISNGTALYEICCINNTL